MLITYRWEPISLFAYKHWFLSCLQKKMLFIILYTMMYFRDALLCPACHFYSPAQFLDYCATLTYKILSLFKAHDVAPRYPQSFLVLSHLLKSWSCCLISDVGSCLRVWLECIQTKSTSLHNEKLEGSQVSQWGTCAHRFATCIPIIFRVTISFL